MTGSKDADYTLPGMPESYWIATTKESHYPAMQADIDVDVAIIGGGIVGVTSALLLKEAGLSVALIEAGRILHGVSGQTTAKVTSQHGLIYDRLISDFGEEQALQYAESNQAAIEKIASLVNSHDIDCDFMRKSAYVYAGSPDSAEKVRREVEAASDLGIPASFEETLPLPFKTYGSVRFDNQAQFHPRKYLCALARKIPGDGCHIFEGTRALEIDGKGPVYLKTDRGMVKAHDVIQATHYPIHDKPGMLFYRLHQSRAYILGTHIEEAFPEGMFINAEQPARSLRSQPEGDSELVLVAGEGHRTGEGGNTKDHYRHLEEWIRSIYTVRSIDYHWSTQDVISADSVPYIGRITPENEHSYLATGFRKWGMTTGTAAAMIISDMILGRDNPWTDVYNPSRFKPVESAKNLISQTLESGKSLLGSRILPVPEDASHISSGKGDIVKIQGERVAAYRDNQGVLHILDPSCRHMGCIVSWNDAERTWDCPCHGSRYNVRGEVVHNPALYGLKEKRIQE